MAVLYSLSDNVLLIVPKLQALKTPDPLRLSGPAEVTETKSCPFFTEYALYPRKSTGKEGLSEWMIHERSTSEVVRVIRVLKAFYIGIEKLIEALLRDGAKETGFNIIEVNLDAGVAESHRSLFSIHEFG